MRLRNGVGHAVAEVELRGVATPAVTVEGRGGEPKVRLRKIHPRQVAPLQERFHKLHADIPRPVAQNHVQFDERRRADDTTVVGNGFGEEFCIGLVDSDGDQSRAVQRDQIGRPLSS